MTGSAKREQLRNGAEGSTRTERKRTKRIRADELVVERGFAEHIGQAQGMIMAGEILSEDRPIQKAGEHLSTDSPLRWRPRRGHGYVGRGGLKMESALRQLGVDPSGYTCLDLGMSTGGFTDCLIQWGAEKVYGVDVGKGLAHRRLVTHPRVVVIEGTHIRNLTSAQVPELCDLCVADLSFNSLARLVTPALKFLKPGAVGVLLVKPQFELSTEELLNSSEGGVVFDEEARMIALHRVKEQLIAMGWTHLNTKASQTKGAKGNQEYFLHLLWSGIQGAEGAEG